MKAKDLLQGSFQKKRIRFFIILIILLNSLISAGYCTGLTYDKTQQSELPNWKTELENFQVVARQAGYMSPSSFLHFLDRVNTTGTTEQQTTGLNLFLSNPIAYTSNFGIGPVILFILLGGLALNMTPCVLPMIPINLAIIGAGAHSGNKFRGFALGGAYGAGIALVYGILGTAAVLTGSTFGTLQSTWWFNLMVAAVFIALGLAMFDVIHIDFTVYNSRITAAKSTSRNAFSTALAMGAVAALLAGACVAPVVIAVLILASDMGTPGLLFPFILGLGMALPWPFAGAGLSFLPKPGKWMVYIKYAFGIIIFCFAAHYAYLGYRIIHPVATGHSNMVESDHFLVINGKDHDKLAWALRRAEQENLPVIIDFRADWCKNCVQFEKKTLANPSVIKKLQGYLFISFGCDAPRNPVVRKVTDHFSLQGIPTFIALKAIKTSGQKDIPGELESGV